MPDPTPPKTVLGRALAVVDAVARARAPVRLCEISASTGLPPATTHRLVAQLTGQGLLARSADRYRIGRRLFELGARAQEERTLRECALPYLEDLLAVTQSVVHLAVLDGTEVLYVERLAGHDPPPSPSRVGGRNPAHCTGVGKAILAFSDEGIVRTAIERGLTPVSGRTIVMPDLLLTQLEGIHAEGVAYDLEETRLGLVCVAAPILDAERQAVASISVTERTTRRDPETLAPAVRACARAISRELRSDRS